MVKRYDFYRLEIHTEGDSPSLHEYLIKRPRGRNGIEGHKVDALGITAWAEYMLKQLGFTSTTRDCAGFFAAIWGVNLADCPTPGYAPGPQCDARLAHRHSGGQWVLG